MANESNLGNLWYTLDIDDKTKDRMPGIIKRITDELKGAGGLELDSIKVNSDKLTEDVKKAILAGNELLTIQVDTKAAQAKIEELAKAANVNIVVDRQVVEAELNKAPFTVNIVCAAGKAAEMISAIQKEINEGGKVVSAKVTLTTTDEKVEELRKKIESKMENKPIRLKSFSFNVSASQVAADIQKQLTAPIEVTLNAKAQNVVADVKTFTVDQAAVDKLRADIMAALNSQPLKINGLDTSTLQTALADAIKKSVDQAKPTIMQKLKDALTGGVQKVKLDVDAAVLAKNLANALKNQHLKIDNLKLSTSAMINDIKQALRKQKFTIEIAVNKMQVSTAVQEALKQAGYQNVMNYSASDARLDRNAREQAMADARLAREKERLRKAHEDAERAATRNANAHQHLTRSVNNTTLATNSLGNVMGNVLSVYAIKNFASEIINIGGELEKMKLAMGSIMGDTYKASTIFQQVSDLSMVSPFDVQDLVTYTKQLNAFGIKYNELYDTTKRLSDIAAAVGVSFGRIAYEYGQTSARGWLDGRELRMFANSGIPLLQKLADYYTRVKDTVITPAMVREMVTKREVSFGDVKKVLWELTNEGGAFYQMQEVMAESLRAKWRNLENDWNLMLGNIAESSVGNSLKGLAETLMKLVENWRAVSASIMPVVFWLTTYKVTQALANMQTTAGTKTLTSFAAAAKQASYNIKGLVVGFAKNPMNWVILAMTAAAYAIGKFNEKVAESEKRIEELETKANEGFRNLNQFMESASFKTPPVNDAQFEQSIKEMREYIKDYAPDAGDLLKNADAIDTLKGKYEYLKGTIVKIAEAYEHLIDLKGVFEASNDMTDGFFDDSMLENLEEAQSSYRELEKGIKKAVKESGIGLSKALEEARNASEEFRKAVTNEDGSLKSQQTQLRTLIIQYRTLFDTIAAGYQRVESNATNYGWFASGDPFKNIRGFINTFDTKVKDAREDIAGFGEQLEEEVARIKADKPLFSAMTEESQKRTITLGITAFLNDKIQDPFIRQLVYDDAIVKKFILQPSMAADDDVTNPGANNDDKDKKDHQLEAWKERQKQIKEAYKEYKKWYDLYHDEQKAIAKTKENPLFADLNVDPSALKKNLQDLRDEIVGSTKARRDLKMTVGGDIFGIDYDGVKDNASKAVEAMKEQIDKDTKDWNLFNKLFDATGDKAWAFKTAFNTAKQLWDEQTDKMAGSLQDALLSRTGDVDKAFGIDWDMTKEEAEKFFGENGDLLELYNKTRDLIESNGYNFYEGLAETYKNILSIDKQIAAVDAKRAKELERARKANSSQADINAINYKYDQELSNLNLQKLKQDINWEAVFSDLNNLTKKSLKTIRKQLVDFRKSKEYKNMKIVDKEAIGKAMTDIDKALMKKEGIFTPIIDAMKEYKAALKDLEDAEIEYQKALTSGDDAIIAAATERRKNAANSVSTSNGAVKQAENYALDNVRKMTSIANSLATAGDNALGTVAGAFSQIYSMTGETWTGVVAAILEALDAIGDDFDQFFSNLVGSILNAIGGILDSELSIFRGNGLGDLLKSADYSEYNELKNSFDDLNKVWDQVLEKKKEYINESWGTEASRTAEEAQRIIDAQLEINRKLALSRLQSGASTGSHSISYRMWKGSYKDVVNGQNWRDVAKEISGAIGAPFEGMEDMLNMSADQLQWIKENYPALWASLDSDFQQYLQNIIDYGEESKKVVEDARDQITQTSFDSMRDSFKSALLDMNSSAEDFADNLKELMANAMISNYVLGDDFENWLNGWLDRMQKAVEQGDIDAQNRLNQEAEEEYERRKQRADQISNALGRTGDDASGNLSSSIASMTEDTAELLGAYLNGIRADVAVNRGFIEQMATVQMPQMNATATAQLTQLTMQTEYLRQINEANASLLTTVASIDERFDKIVDVDKMRCKM